MILRAVRVKGMRCFRNEIHLGPFGDGLNLIHAPNETGKSTLVEAVSRALFDRHSVSGGDMEALRPWGTSLSPEIGLEFEVAGRRYRLHKRLLDDALCTLEEMTDRGWTLLEERDRADEFVRGLLHGDLPGRGPTRMEHRGLARTLWSLQEPGAGGGYSVSAAVAAQLRAALPDGVAIGTRSDDLAERLRQRFEEHFTPTGRPRRRSPIELLERDIARLRDEERAARDACDEVDRAAERLGAISHRLERLRAEREECTRRMERYRRDARGVRELRAEIEGLEADAIRAERDHGNAARDLQRHRDAARLADACAGRLGDVGRKLQEQTTALGVAEALVAEARDELAGAERARRAAAGTWEAARKTNRALDLQREHRELVERGDRLDVLARRVTERRRELGDMPRPTDDQITTADGLQGEIARLQAHLEVAGLQAEVRVLRDGQVRLTGGADALTRDVPAGGAVAYRAGASLEIELPQVARIRVVSGAREPAALQQGLARAREGLRSLLAPFAAENADDLRGILAGLTAREERVRHIEEEMRGVAGPHGDADSLRAAQAGARVALTRLLNELGLTDDDLPAMETQDEDALERAHARCQAEEDRRRGQLDGRRDAHETLRAGTQGLQSELADLGARRDVQLTVMGTVLERAGCADADALRRRVHGLRERARAAGERLEARRAELPPAETDPEALLETQGAALAEIDERERGLLDQRGNARGVIERARTEGRYERLTEIREDLDTMGGRLVRLRAEADAVRLLRLVLAERREAAVGGQLPGLEDAVGRMLAHISGRDRRVRLDGDLQILGIAPDSDATPHGVGHFSAGMREQLDLVARLALGEAYAAHHGRTMMVLDDALLQTDPIRHDRVKELLKRAANLLQIIILTSHPDRHLGIVPAAHRFDLEALAAPRDG